ncbi:MAG TPA: M48 family metallopeptidase [Pyrinomonadaceae bacterium]|nr:M48 family metallopeptidase [Pyrinomonadaceae bacterium]
MTKALTVRGARRRLALRVSLSLLLAAQAACGGWRPWGGEDSAGGAPAAPHFRPGFNLFSPEQDVELGRRSAAEIARQVPLVRDEEVSGYVSRLGARLAAHAPGEKFPYQFQVVSSREVNAFALPGGFIFVNAGTVAAARNEGELAGVVAHEIMHVALRHGTNQVSKAYLARAGLGILGAIAGGESPDLGRVIESVGGVGANVLFLKFGRTAERQSDLGGAQVLAAAGYDPRDMAGFFETLQREGGQRLPEFLSDHPDPGNRVASINEVIPALEVRPDPVRTSPEFERAKARLSGRRLAASAEPERKGPREPGDAQPAARLPQPDAAAAEYRAPDGSFAFQYPQNWETLAVSESELIFAPAGAYGRKDGAAYVTHGLFVGTVAAAGGDLAAATDAFLQQLLRANHDFQAQGAPRRVTLAGREAYAVAVAGPSPVTGKAELNLVHTAFDSDGRLFYLIAVVPEEEFETYRPAFEGVVRSLRLA